MLTVRVIPCLDCRDGRVVKGVRFSELRDSGSPSELALAYQHDGADELVLLDVVATPRGDQTRLATVAAVRSVLSLPLTVGGGVRGVADATALLQSGADKVAVNTAAVRRPELISELAIDAARRPSAGWQVVVESGAVRCDRDVTAWAAEGVRRGAGEILLTSWDRDGTRAGYDLKLIGAVADAVPVPVIASGGAATPRDLAAVVAVGASAVLAASIFHDGDFTVAEVKSHLASQGIEVRP
ncbi:MAG: imidazole glycerol phosphate synthase subunit HisF [Acidimicrobiia bacterium]